MADIKISQLHEKSKVHPTDVLIIEDDVTTSQVSVEVLLEDCSKEGHHHSIEDVDALQQALDGKLDYVKLAQVATSGDYGDLMNLPYIPTKVSDLENDNNYATTEYVNSNVEDVNNQIEQNFITTQKNNQVSVSEIIGVAKSYYDVRFKEDDTPLFFYDTSHTPTSDNFNVNDPVYGGAIDCSTYIGLVLRGIPVSKSPYKSLLGESYSDYVDEDIVEDDVNGDSDNDGVDIDTWRGSSLLANTNDYSWAINPFEWSNKVVNSGQLQPVRRASQLAQWMHERGMSIPLDETFSNVEPGDIIFWAKTDSNGDYKQPNRYMRISHVAICINKMNPPTDDPKFPSKYPWKHTMLEVTTISPYVLNRTLEKVKPEEVVMVCRPDLGALSSDSFAGNIQTTWDIKDISELYRPGTYYLTSKVTGGLPEGISNGIYLTLKVERTLTKQGKPYSLIQTLVNTKTNECEYRRTQYCYSHAPNETSWTSWEAIATESYVKEEIAKVISEGEIELSRYVTEEELSSKSYMTSQEVRSIAGQDIYKRRVVNQFPAKFGDYATIVANQGVSYIYPQSFFIDEEANELLVMFSPDWSLANNQRWVVIYDWTTTKYKSCFQCGNAAGEGIVVRYKNGARLLYARYSPENYYIGEFDITVTPANMSSIQPINSYDVGLYSNFTYSDGRWYIEQNGAILGAYNRRNLVGVFDESFNKIGEIYFNSESIGYFNNAYTNMISKKQGFTVYQGKFIFSCGGYIAKSDERTYYGDYGIRVCDMHGNHIESGLVRSHDLMTALEVQKGITSSRIEAEGVCSVGGKLYSLCVNKNLNYDSDATKVGIIIFEEFATEDYIDCSAFYADDVTINKTIYETKMFPRGYQGYIYNPITGARITKVEEIMDLMIELDLTTTQFYSTSNPLLWFDGTTLANSKYVKISNLNNGSFTIELKDANISERYWLYGTSGSRTVKLVPKHLTQSDLAGYATQNYVDTKVAEYEELQERVTTLEGIVATLTTTIATLVDNSDK